MPTDRGHARCRYHYAGRRTCHRRTGAFVVARAGAAIRRCSDGTQHGRRGRGAVRDRTRADARHALTGLVLSAALAPGAATLDARGEPRHQPRLADLPAIRIDAALLSRDPAIVAANRADPLVHHGAVPHGRGWRAHRKRRGGLRVPVLVYHGTEDKPADGSSRAFGARVGSPDRTLTLYEGGFHETMNDLERDRVIDALIAWIHARVPAR